MSTKDEWKKAGKNIGHAFANLGRAFGTTAKNVFANDPKEGEERESTKDAWKNVGHGFKDAGVSLGKAGASTIDKLDDETKEKEDLKNQEGEVIDAEVKPAQENKEEE